MKLQVGHARIHAYGTVDGSHCSSISSLETLAKKNNLHFSALNIELGLLNRIEGCMRHTCFSDS